MVCNFAISKVPGVHFFQVLLLLVSREGTPEEFGITNIVKTLNTIKPVGIRNPETAKRPFFQDNRL